MRQALPNNERQGAGVFFPQKKRTYLKGPRAMFEAREFFVTWKGKVEKNDPFRNGFLAGAMLVSGSVDIFWASICSGATT